MRRLRLTLIGEPKLWIEDRVERIGTRTVFEVLAYILVAPGLSVSRKEVADSVWPHLEPSARAAQLRIVLTKLRSELDRLGIRKQFQLESKRLSVEGSVTTDIQILHSDAFEAFSDLIPFCRPVAPGWTSERWRQYEEILSNSLAEAYLHLKNTKKLVDSGGELDFLRAAVAQYRTSVVFHVELLRSLNAIGAKSEALEHVISFEDAWVERFGVGDIPDLWKQVLERSNDAPPITEPILEDVRPALPTRMGPGRRIESWWLVVTILIAALMVYTAKGAWEDLGQTEERVGYDQWDGIHPEIQNESDREPGRLWIRRIEPVELGGKSARVWEIFTQNSDVRALQRNSDGGFVFEVVGYRSEWVKKVAWDSSSGAQSTLREGRAVLDSLGPRRIVQVNDGLLVVEEGTDKTQYQGDAEFPRFLGERFLPDGRVLATKMCGHVYGCHRYLVIVDRGHIARVNPIADAQVVAFSFMDGPLIYGKFSRGKSAGWRYSPFVFDTNSGRFRVLNGAPFVGVSDSGYAVRRPEKTDVFNGDYQTKETGEVRIVAPNGFERKLEVDGFDRFRSLYLIGDLLVVDIERAHESDLALVDMNGTASPEFRKRMANIQYISGNSILRAVLVKLKGQNANWCRHLLIESTLPVPQTPFEPSTETQIFPKQSHLT